MARYDEIESRVLLPVFMRADAFDDAMADIVDEFGADAAELSRDFSTWDHIDTMDEEAIDALADELNIIWYDKLATIESKREIIKNCKHLQSKIGTKWALEQILGMFFTGEAVVTEWFDYEEGPGEPNHFRIETECFSGTGEESGRFLAILSKVKRKSVVLDNVLAVISAESTLSPCAWLQDWRIDEMEARRDQ